jgi:hypothetical protein
LRERTKAFLAGLIDSEGDASISRHISKERTYTVKGKKYTYFGYTSYGVNFVVYNTSLRLMKWLVAQFGGSFRVLRKESKTRQAVLEWKPESSAHATNVLRSILPYIIIKQKQAKLCLDFLELGGDKKPLERETLFTNYKKVSSRSVTTETNHVFKWKNNLINAYFSAFFDGEGTAAVYRNSSTIWIPNSDKAILELANIIYKGNGITGGNRKTANNSRLPEYRISVPVANMEKFILRMLPYSVIKREQLILTLENLRGVTNERRSQIKKRLFELKHPLKNKDTVWTH